MIQIKINRRLLIFVIGIFLCVFLLVYSGTPNKGGLFELDRKLQIPGFFKFNFKQSNKFNWRLDCMDRYCLDASKVDMLEFEAFLKSNKFYGFNGDGNISYNCGCLMDFSSRPGSKTTSSSVNRAWIIYYENESLVEILFPPK